jgi:hypothetical protein
MNDPAAVIGVDENHNVPPLAETDEVPDQPHPISSMSLNNSDDDMDVDKKTVTMVVLDWIVMGPTVSFLFMILCIIDTNPVFEALRY